jgi:hypothetical protein
VWHVGGRSWPLGDQFVGGGGGGEGLSDNYRLLFISILVTGYFTLVLLSLFVINV